MFDLAGRVERILETPWEVLEYERWLAEQPEESDDYLFADARARFEARDEDTPRTPGDLRVVEARGELSLASERLGGSVAVRGVGRRVVERLLSLIDGRRTVGELRALAGTDRPALDRLIEATLGRVLFVPDAVAALERRISGTELVRFVGVPYEIVRAYWENMAAVRARAERELDAIGDAPAFVALLRGLHVVALLGEDLRSFYRPRSRITRRGVRPGALYDAPTRIVRGELGPLLLEGPRIGVSLIGGERYHQAICEGAGDPDALLPARVVQGEDGLPWGELLTGRALSDADVAAWFCPPRPLTAAHFESLHLALRRALEATAAAQVDTARDALARFHWRFVRLHPFRCANQSLAMNLVNAVLARAQGSGIPHLVLDQLALRLDERAYARVFDLAARAHAASGGPEERWATLANRKARAYGFIQRLQQTKDRAGAEALVRAEPEAARLALIPT